MHEKKVKRGEKCPTCERYYDRHVVVEGLIVKDQQVLLELRDNQPDKGKWAFPGGFIEWNETTEESVVREVQEEIGVKTQVIALFGVYSDPKRDAYNTQNIALVYELELVTQEFVAQPGEVADIRWFDLSDLPEQIAFDHREKIAEYKKRYAVR